MMWKGHWQGIGYRNESGARSGLRLRHWRWGQACGDRCVHYEAEGLGRAAPSKGEHTWSAWPKPQSGSRLCEIATKDLRSIPMENMNGLSLDQAIVCPYLTAVDTCIWITNSTFPSSHRELFAVGDMLLGPRIGTRSVFERDIGCGSKFLCSETALESSAEWRTTNLKNVWFSPTAGEKPTGSIPAPLEDAS